MKKYITFKDWYEEMVGWGYRFEIVNEDLGILGVNISYPPVKRQIEKWLEAAFNAGRNE